MKKGLVLLCMGLFSSGALADAGSYECSLVDEHDSWSVQVDLKQKKAQFFDNDHWTPLKGQSFYYEYSAFVGSDPYTDAKVGFAFNRSTLRGTLTDNVGTRNEKSYGMKCHETEMSLIDSE